MPANFRALIVVMVLAAAVIFVIRRSATTVISEAEFRLWIKTWFAVTVIGFVTPNFWLMLFLVAVVVLIISRRYPYRPALFMLLFTAMPISGVRIPGFGIVNYLFEINYLLLLVLLLLVPLVLLHPRRDQERRASLEDTFFFGFFFLSLLLTTRAGDQTVTNFIRTGFLLTLESAVPYLAFSRYLQTRDEINRVMLAFLVPVLIYAPIGVFEMVRHWSLYLHPPDTWGLNLGRGSASRAGLMRANGPVGHGSPIVFGSYFVLASGFLLALSPGRVFRARLWSGAGAIWAGVISSLSRGPWVGVAVVYLVYWLTTPQKISKAAMYGLPILFVTSLVLVTPFGSKIWALLPFIGTTEAEATVDYRVQVWNVSWDVIMQYPLFGHVAAQELPAMQVLMTGQGIVDVVNTYVGVALHTGLLGLSIFGGFFTLVLAGLWRSSRSPLLLIEEIHSARALFATMVGLLVVITTVSPVAQVPFLYWSLAGVCVAYGRYLRRASLERTQVANRKRSTTSGT